MHALQMNVPSVNGNTQDPSVTLQETWSLNINCNILNVKTSLVCYELGYNICKDQVSWYVVSLGIGKTLYQVGLLVYFLIQMGESTLQWPPLGCHLIALSRDVHVWVYPISNF
jgi:hypothetical protein